MDQLSNYTDITGPNIYPTPAYVGWCVLIAFLASFYFIGSIPFGWILTRLAGKGDIRKIGSGNIGATNVLRTGNKSLALLTLILDGAKGALAVWLASLLPGDAEQRRAYMSVAAVSVAIGHMFPIWLKFRGGKGVATAFGALLVIAMPIKEIADYELWSITINMDTNTYKYICFGIIPIILWLSVVFATRYSSLAAITAMLTVVLECWYIYVKNAHIFDGCVPRDYGFSSISCAWTDRRPEWLILMLLPLLVIARHHANIRRLLNGTEPKIGQHKKPDTDANPPAV